MREIVRVPDDFQKLELTMLPLYQQSTPDARRGWGVGGGVHGQAYSWPSSNQPGKSTVAILVSDEYQTRKNVFEYLPSSVGGITGLSSDVR